MTCFFPGPYYPVNILPLNRYSLKYTHLNILQQEKYGINQHYQHHTPPDIPPSTNNTATITATVTIIVIRPGPRWPHIRLERLQILPNNIPSWRILTNHIPPLRPVISPILILDIAPVGVIVSAIHRRTPNLQARSPDKLREVTGFLGEAGGFFIVVFVSLVAPGADG